MFNFIHHIKTFHHHRPRQRGDTLVEVIIAIVLLNFVLFSSFAVANRSRQLGINARERTQASQLIQSQAEALRAVRDQATSFAAFKTQIEAVQDGSGQFYIDRNPATGRWDLHSGRLGSPPINASASIFTELWISGSFPQSDKFVGNVNLRWPLLGQGPEQTSNLALKLTDNNIPAALLAQGTPPPPPPPPPCSPPELKIQSGTFSGGGTQVSDPAADGGGARRFDGSAGPGQSASRDFNPPCSYYTIEAAGKVITSGISDEIVNLKVTVREGAAATEHFIQFDHPNYFTIGFIRPFSDNITITIEPQGLDIGESFYLDFINVKQATPNSLPPNVALGKAVYNYNCEWGGFPYTIGTPGKLTDGSHINNIYTTGWYPGCSAIDVMIDLGSSYNLNNIDAWWHYFGCSPGDLCSNGYEYINYYQVWTLSPGGSWISRGSGGFPHAVSTNIGYGNFPNTRYIWVTVRSAFHWIGTYEIEAY